MDFFGDKRSRSRACRSDGAGNCGHRGSWSRNRTTEAMAHPTQVRRRLRRHLRRQRRQSSNASYLPFPPGGRASPPVSTPRLASAVSENAASQPAARCFRPRRRHSRQNLISRLVEFRCSLEALRAAFRVSAIAAAIRAVSALRTLKIRPLI